jgi:POT family proton-dependent oligopeptide transporter
MGLFYLGLVLLIFGNGFFKPNISTTVGKLYEQNDPRRDGAFTIFYMGINLGAFFSPLVCGTLGEKFGWHYGFLAAGVGMLAGMIVLLWGQQRFLGEAGLHPGMAAKAAGAPADAPLTTQEKQRIAVIFILAFFVVFFWSSFELAGSALTLFADQSTSRVLPIIGWEFPASWFQSVNPLLIFVLAPLFSSMWIKLAGLGREPSTPMKMAIGLALLAGGMLLMVLASGLVEGGANKVSALWLCGCYLMCTLGELCLSPIGLSMVTKLSPMRFASLLMGTWFMANFLANLLSGVFAGQYDAMSKTLFFMIPVGTAGGAAVLLFLLVKPLRKWMHGVH